ncbi:MAG: ECF-type sigma factor [Planctomycetota bacterium]
MGGVFPLTESDRVAEHDGDLDMSLRSPDELGSDSRPQFSSEQIDRFIPIVYDELRKRALAELRKSGPQHTLDPTAFVHEVYLSLKRGSGGPWESEQHFLAVATVAIRRAVIDRIRARMALKRGRGTTTPLPPDLPIAEPTETDEVMLKIDGFVDSLRARDGRAADVTTFRVFAGMNEQQIADLLSVSTRTVRRDWNFARAWISRELEKTQTAWSGGVA